MNCDLLSFQRNGNESFDQNLLSTLCALVAKGTGVEKVKAIFQMIQNSVTSPGLYIRAGSRQSSLACQPGFAGYFHCFTSQGMSRR